MLVFRMNDLLRLLLHDVESYSTASLSRSPSLLNNTSINHSVVGRVHACTSIHPYVQCMPNVQCAFDTSISCKTNHANPIMSLAIFSFPIHPLFTREPITNNQHHSRNSCLLPYTSIVCPCHVMYILLYPTNTTLMQIVQRACRGWGISPFSKKFRLRSEHRVRKQRNIENQRNRKVVYV
jgi:hypothetical protein